MAKQNPRDTSSDSPPSDEEADELKAGGKDNEEIIEVALKRFKLAEDAEIQIRLDELDDKKFFAGEQWDQNTLAKRRDKSRPVVTVNRLPQQVRQVTNDQRQNRPSIKVNPVDDRADVETAKVYQGMIRHIEYNSDADLAYDTAFESAAISGRGFWRVLTDFSDPLSFDQEIKIAMIQNHFMVYLDPTSVKPDGSDSNWGFIFEDMPVEDFRAEFPDAELAQSQADFEAVNRRTEGWAKKATIRVAEYFYKTFKPETILLLDNGQVIFEKQKGEAEAAGFKVVKTRKTILPAIKWVKLTATEVLDQKNWPGQWVPIIPVIGQRSDIDGKKIIEGIVRNAKDPQRIYNYMKSAMVEAIALAPKAPYVMAEGQDEGHEAQWESANIENYSALKYKPVDLNGQLAPPPQRNVLEPAIQAMNMVMSESGEDIKATTGIYDSTLGNRSNEQSGIAIQRRNQQAQTSNFHLVDNLTRSIRHTGRICIELIPIVYDTASQTRILGDDGTPKMVPVNQEFEDKGVKKAHMLSYGKYDCTVSTGPSFQTKRQEAAASMMDLSKAYPKLMDVAGDVMVNQMDWPESQQVAERLKKSMPPELVGDEDPKANQVPPQVQAQMQQQQMLIKNLTEQLNHKTQQIESKTLELESRERIETMKVQVNAEIELAKISQRDGIAILQAEIAQLERRQKQLGSGQPFPEEEIEPPAGPNNQALPAPNPNPTGGPSPGTPMGG